MEANIAGKEFSRLLWGGRDFIAPEFIICRDYDQFHILRAIFRNESAYCNGVADCATGSDELCPYVTIRDDKYKRFNITREQWAQKLFEDEDGRTWCTTSERSRISSWVIIDDCKRCNKIYDCASGIDELGCLLLPSLELPVYCCLVVLVLGVLLHLGWNIVTKTCEDEAKEMEIVGAIGRQLEEAIDLIIEAAIEDRPFPENSFEIVHRHCGGIDLLIGTRHGKKRTQKEAYFTFFSSSSILGIKPAQKIPC